MREDARTGRPLHRSSQLVGTLEIGGVACGLACNDAVFAERLAARYSGFLRDRSPEFTVDVDVRTDAPVSHGLGDLYARVGGDRGRITVDGIDFSGVFDEERRRGHIVQPAEPAALETLLTAIYAARLLRDGGCLLHAAAIIRDDRAYVFYGPSGSGKTTVAELVGAGVVSDEIAVIRPDGDGWTVSAVPWRGTSLTARLGGFCRLRQSSTTRFEPLAPSRAVRSLLGCAFFARPSDGEVQAFLDAAGAMATRVPVWDMQFRRDRGFWAALPRGEAA